MKFRHFINQLRTSGKLVEITHPISPEFEAPRIAKQTGAPVLFHDVSGKKAIMNLLGSRDELAAMLDVPKEGIIQRLAAVAPAGEVRIVEYSPTSALVNEIAAVWKQVLNQLNISV